MRKNIHELIFAILEKLGITSKEGDAAKSVIDPDGGMMDLCYDRLGERSKNAYDISLAHYFKQNGDLCCDPDMEIRIYPYHSAAEALTFQMAIPPIYQEVYPEPDKVCPKYKKELNIFLNQWLKNCIDQGHTFNKQDIAA